MPDRVIRNFKRPSAAIIERFRELDVSTVYEAGGRFGLMSYDIKPVVSGVKLLGPAFTVLLPQGDNLMVHKALTLARGGDVLVIAVRGGGASGAIWGELTTCQGFAIGLAGLVTEAVVRDVKFIRESRFPCFSKGTGSGGTAKLGPGSINVAVSCGNVVVRPGDIVLGDDDGVVVIPKDSAEAVAQKSEERMTKERQTIAELKAGKTTYDLYGFDAKYRQLGIEESQEEAD